MKVKEGFGNLIDDVTFMPIAKDILPDESIEVDIHELEE